jgi:hypothetical protein
MPQPANVWYHDRILTVLAVRRVVYETRDQVFHGGHDVRAVGRVKMGDVRARRRIVFLRLFDGTCLQSAGNVGDKSLAQ